MLLPNDPADRRDPTATPPADGPSPNAAARLAATVPNQYDGARATPVAERAWTRRHGEPPPASGPRPPDPGRLAAIDDRPSTEREREALVAAAGGLVAEAATTVNAALAAWPMLRAADPEAARVEYAAVCLYLGSGPGGALAVDAALRAGQPTLPGLLPCLVGGLRRLPTHRAVTLWLDAAKGRTERRYPVGALLTTPSFHNASAELDLAAPGAAVDVLVWSRSARRACVLGPRRPVQEVVFLPGSMFRVLATRAAETPDAPDEAAGPTTPTVLLREVLPHEVAGFATGLDAADHAALAKLDQALARRRAAQRRRVTDPDLVARLAGELVQVGPGAPGDRR